MNKWHMIGMKGPIPRTRENVPEHHNCQVRTSQIPTVRITLRTTVIICNTARSAARI